MSTDQSARGNNRNLASFLAKLCAFPFVMLAGLLTTAFGPRDMSFGLMVLLWIIVVFLHKKRIASKSLRRWGIVVATGSMFGFSVSAVREKERQAARAVETYQRLASEKSSTPPKGSRAKRDTPKP